MSSSDDTLNIQPQRALPQTENNPAAAAAARALLAKLELTPSTQEPSMPVATAPVQTEPNPQPEPQRKESSLPLTTQPVSTSLPPTARAAPKRHILPSRLKPVISAVAFFALIMLLFKAPIIFNQIRYNLNPPPAVETPATTVSANQPSTLSIAKLNVKAPIIYEKSIQEAAIQKSLQRGVAHYGITPKPGEGGNSVIVGHSSNDWWEPGNYKFVFVLLDKLKPGDKISLTHQGKQYVYEVTGTKVVAPTDLSVLAPTSQPTLTLITCTPPGTAWKRLIIQAKQITPEPSSTQSNQLVDASQNRLPGTAPGFLDQVSRLWTNLWDKISGPFRGEGATPTQPEGLPGA